MSINDRLQNPSGPPEFQRMRCPGCKSRLKFPARRAGSSFKHKCGHRLTLAPDFNEKASTEQPGFVPSEDVSGLLPPVKMETRVQPSKDGFGRMRCPGCQRSIKFPRKRDGARFTHKCGARYQLRADASAKASTEQPGFVPSEDVSGLLKPVSIRELVEKKGSQGMVSMRCPGCDARLKFPVRKLGVRFKHKCGKRFKLDPAVVESTSTSQGGPRSEDISGMLDRLVLEEGEDDNCFRMHCPGCFRRLRYDKPRESESYTHSCGSSFKLRADDALETSAPDDPLGSEYLGASHEGAPAATGGTGIELAIKAKPATTSGTGSGSAAVKMSAQRRARARQAPVKASSGGAGLLIGGLLILAIGGALLLALKNRGQEAAPRDSGQDPLSWKPMESDQDADDDDDDWETWRPRSSNTGGGGAPSVDLSGVGEEPPDWWKEREREAAERAAAGENADEDDGQPRPHVEVEDVGVGPVEPAPLVDPGLAWDARFDALAELYEIEAERRTEMVPLLELAMREGLPAARADFEVSNASLALFDTHRKLIKKLPPLQAQLLEHRKVYVAAAFVRASGPDQLEKLEKQCRDFGLKAEAAEVETLRELIKPSDLPKAARAAREQKRARLEEARAEVRAFLVDTMARAPRRLTDVVEWMEEQEFAPVAAKLRIAGLVDGFGLEPDAGGALLDRLDAIKPAATEDDGVRTLEREFEKKLDRLIGPIAKKLGGAANDLVKAGLPGLGFDVFQTLLALDPDNPGAHKGLGHVRIDDTWYRGYDAAQLKKGFVWDDELGWIKTGSQDRYDNWEVYDIQEGAWKDYDAANAQHSKITDPWRLESEHFRLISTADLDLSAKVLKRLESVFLQVFRQYDSFFKGDMGARFIFGAGKMEKKLVVNLYRSEEQFHAYADPPADWAAGFYSGGRGASFFYCTGKRVSIRTLQHELVHQILGEFSEDHAPSWLAEGAAVFLEDAFFDGQFLSLGDLVDNDRVHSYARNLRSGGSEHTFSEMLRFDSSAAWDSGDISQNYRGAGAIVYFLMNFDGGRYRGDFIEMLSDAYTGRLQAVEDYFGLSLASLQMLQDRFYRIQPLGPSRNRQ